MQAVLISSKNREKGREETEKIFKELKIDKFDVISFEFEKSVGIPDIREIQKKIYLKPFKSEIKAVVIDATNGITIEAQNALLKTLEETPDHTIIIILSENASELLPTISSRCKLIEITSRLSPNEEILSKFNSKDKLKLAQDLSKDKTEALDFIEGLIILLRKDLTANYKKVKLLQKFHTIIKGTNTNLRLTLENLFLSL